MIKLTPHVTQVRFMFKYSLDTINLTLTIIRAQILYVQVDMIYFAKDNLFYCAMLVIMMKS